MVERAIHCKEGVVILVYLLIALSLTSVATYLCVNVNEEIVKVAMACVALICLLISIACAPMWLKLLLVGVPLLIWKPRRAKLTED